MKSEYEHEILITVMSDMYYFKLCYPVSIGLFTQIKPCRFDTMLFINSWKYLTTRKEGD